MVELTVVVSYLVVVSGLVISYQFVKNRNSWGTMFGLAFSLTGVSLVMISYSLISDLLVAIVLGVESFVVLTLLYPASGWNRRALLLLPLPALLLTRSYVYPLPIIGFFVYLVLSVVIVAAYDHSGVDVATCLTNVDKPVRKILWPMLRIQKLLERGSKKTRPARGALALAYFTLFASITILLPLGISEVLNGILPAETMMVIALVYPVLSWEVCKRQAGP